MRSEPKLWFIFVSIPLLGYAAYLLLDLDILSLPKPSASISRFVFGVLLGGGGLVFLLRWMTIFQWYRRYVEDDASEGSLKLGSPIMVSVIVGLFILISLSFRAKSGHEALDSFLMFLAIGAGIPALKVWYQYFTQQKKIRDAKARAPESKPEKEFSEGI